MSGYDFPLVQLRRCDGIGRHNGLKIRGCVHHVGSSPITGTNLMSEQSPFMRSPLSIVQGVRPGSICQDEQKIAHRPSAGCFALYIIKIKMEGRNLKMVINLLFSLAILVSIWFTFINVGNLIRKQNVPAINILIMSMALTAVITHVIGLW